MAKCTKKEPELIVLKDAQGDFLFGALTKRRLLLLQINPLNMSQLTVGLNIKFPEDLPRLPTPRPLVTTTRRVPPPLRDATRLWPPFFLQTCRKRNLLGSRRQPRNSFKHPQETFLPCPTLTTSMLTPQVKKVVSSLFYCSFCVFFEFLYVVPFILNFIECDTKLLL